MSDVNTERLLTVHFELPGVLERRLREPHDAGPADEPGGGVPDGGDEGEGADGDVAVGGGLVADAVADLPAADPPGDLGVRAGADRAAADVVAVARRERLAAVQDADVDGADCNQFDTFIYWSDIFRQGPLVFAYSFL